MPADEWISVRGYEGSALSERDKRNVAYQRGDNRRVAYQRGTRRGGWLIREGQEEEGALSERDKKRRVTYQRGTRRGGWLIREGQEEEGALSERDKKRRVTYQRGTRRGGCLIGEGQEEEGALSERDKRNVAYQRGDNRRVAYQRGTRRGGCLIREGQEEEGDLSERDKKRRVPYRRGARRGGIGKAEISHVVEKTVPALLVKSGETTPRTRDAAIEMILEMAAYKDVKGLGVIADLVTQPTKSKQAPWRLLKSRLEIIDKLLPVLDVESGQAGCLSLEAVMHVAVPALDHNNGEVRDAAVKLIFELYKKVKDPVKGFLPNDEPATRKNPLYRSIFDGFDHIDGKPTESERRAQAKIERQNAEKHKQAEIEALQAQLQALREMAGEDKSQATSKDKSDKKKKAEEPALDMDKMCIFCGEQNESFTEDMLDLHYWKSCPMLNRCEHCSQVVEVSGFNDHLLTECDAKDRNAQCPRCKEVMLKVDLDDHLVQAGCTARGKDAAICPLCKTKIGSEEEIEALQAQLQALREMAGEDKSQATSKDKSDKKKKAEEPALDMDKYVKHTVYFV
ncbi:predicted protein [Nematostella vectensis]|uniref:Centrosomal protein CEP104 Zn finger domain-containing protein n=1 Tax=Nematostella vectensis TaxID=45351 RepID=A7SCR2_NEMVE|nr:predicted protein [Nematostella vectensis]|eukprot:XP_001630507.1 predicted protein [Nematostella vectensis]